MSDYVYHNGELYHYGIPGMKWGVRRYQNADGSLTEEGKKRLRNYQKNEIVKMNKNYAKAKAASQADTMDKIKSRQSKFLNVLDPAHDKNDKAIESNVKFEKTAKEAYKSINKPIGKMSYNDMIKESKAANYAAAAAGTLAAVSGISVGILLDSYLAIGMATATSLLGAKATGFIDRAADNARYRTRIYNDTIKEVEEELFK